VYENKKIAITGYNGYIGSALYNKLKKDKCDVTPVDIDLSNCEKTIKFFKNKKI